jgi:ASC-1-like (ASCH) protein
MKQLEIRDINKDIFEAIRDGKKKVETRAATPKYSDIKSGDRVDFVCGNESFVKQIKKVETFKTISEMLDKYEVEEINPKIRSEKELEDMYYSFPNYKEKIEKYGLIAFELI